MPPPLDTYILTDSQVPPETDLSMFDVVRDSLIATACIWAPKGRNCNDAGILLFNVVTLWPQLVHHRATGALVVCNNPTAFMIELVAANEEMQLF